VRPTPIDAVGVIIPAHEEEHLITGCMRSIALAGSHPALAGIPVTLVVVLDRCSDRTGDRAEAAGRLDRTRRGVLRTIVVDARYASVGRSRALGTDIAIEHFAGADPARLWLATTDADSAVPFDWLAHHLALRRRGFHAAAGTVRVSSWHGQPPHAPTLHEARYRLGGASGYGHHHVHGANLAFTARAYQAAGGFAPVPTAEDHLLWRGIRTTGLAAISTPFAPVSTSARREGRAPDGFAGFLRSLEPAEV